MKQALDFVKKLKKYNPSSILKKSEVKAEILRLNKMDQLWRGVDVNGKQFGFYSLKTQFITEGRSFIYNGSSRVKNAGDPIFLYDTGDFYKSFKVNVYGQYFTISADDLKDGKSLTERYGDIIGLSQESREKLSIFLRKHIEEDMRQYALKAIS